MQTPNKETLKILISTGELSGDLHAAKVLESLNNVLKKTSPERQIQARAMGDKNLKNAGADLIIDSGKSGSITGFNLFKILTVGLWAWIKMAWQLFSWRPEVLFLVDYPDFNLRLARVAKLLNIPVFYHIPPKVWAWREQRVKTIKKSVDNLSVIFPFEKEFFERHGLNQVSYVGHPFCDDLPNKYCTLERQQELKNLGLNPDAPVIAVFVGSRQSEVNRHLPLVWEALDKVRQTIPEVQALFALAASINSEQIEQLVAGRPWAKFIVDDSYKVLKLADIGLLKSGTCNLEAAFAKLPFACFYVASFTSELIVKLVVKIKEYSLVNIIKPGSIPEFVEKRANSKAIAAELLRLLQDNDYHKLQQEKLNQVAEALKVTEQQDAKIEANSAADRTATLLLSTARKTKSPFSIFKRVFKYLNPYRMQFGGALLCMVIFGASDGIVPFLVKYILDGVFANQDKSLLFILPFILLGFTVIRAASDFGQQFLSARIGHNIVRDIRNQMHAHIVALTPDFFIKNSVGALLSRFTSDTVLVSALLTNSVASVIRDSIRIVALLATAFYLDPVLALIAFVFMPIGIIPVYRFGKRMRSLSRRGQEAIGSISSLVQEVILGNRVVKVFGRETHEIARFSSENDRLNNTFIKSEKVRALTGPVNEVLATLAIAGVLLYGGYSVISGERSQGDFIAFLLSVFLLYDPFKKLTRVNSAIQQGASGAERIFELLDQQPSVVENPSPKSLSPANTVDFEHVYYSYNYENGSSTSWALEDIQLHVPEGTTLALVGYSGAGKTTLVDLIPRFIDPQKGIIKIGGVDIRQVSLAELRSRITMVSQNTFLFNDTIYNNIAYGNRTASHEQVIAAAQAAHAHGFITKLPEQYDTIVGQDGHSLSGGERQRISIARALLKDSPILILDEATAALDNRSEREVQMALDRLQENRTTIVIAHRLSTIQNADCIIVLENGKIVEAGSHKELLDQGGLFAKLHELQFSRQAQETSQEMIN